MTITNANVKRVDAADNVVAQASDGQFKSCSEVKSAGFCWHETAEKHCALTCSANQIIHANKRALSSKGECKALNDKCDDDYPHQDSQSNCCDGLRCHRWTECKFKFKLTRDTTHYLDLVAFKYFDSTMLTH